MTATRAPNVGAVAEDGVVYAAVLPDGPIFVLTGDAAVAWHAATGRHAATAWRAATGTDATDDVADGYIAALVDAGLLIVEKES